jgi:transposase
MTFEKICIVNGRQYKSLVKGYRDSEGKVRHQFIKYLGAVEPKNKKRKNPNAGRKPALKAREFNSEEKQVIARALKNSMSFVKDRAKIIKLSNEGNFVKEICEKLKFDKKKVGKIINKFNKEGIKVFDRKKGTGRPRRINNNERARVIESLNTNPKKLGLHFNNWSRNRISDYLKNNGINISPSYVGEIIKTDEIRYKKKRSKMYSNDKNFLRSTLR